MVSTAYCAPEEKAEAPKPAPVKIAGELLPTGKLAKGTIVRVQFDDALKDYLQKFDDAAKKLPEETQVELRKNLKPGQPVPFDERFGISKEDYSKYIACGNKRVIENVAPVVAGFVKTDNPDIWAMASSTEKGPTPLSTLRYDAKKDQWESPNGILERKPDLVYDELNNLGAWTAHEWLYESKTAFSHSAENVLMGKTKDGKSIYVIYNYLEVSTEGTPIDTRTLVLRFPVDAVKTDPLQEKALKAAGSGHNL